MHVQWNTERGTYGEKKKWRLGDLSLDLNLKKQAYFWLESR